MLVTERAKIVEGTITGEIWKATGSTVNCRRAEFRFRDTVREILFEDLENVSAKMVPSILTEVQ